MDEPGFSIANANIAIIGLGLMGGSLALGLKEHCGHLAALDIDPAVLAQARKRAVVHQTSSDPAEILADANLVILACPVPAILEWLERLPDFIQHDCIVMDIGSTKRAIVAGMQNLPDNFDPIGGHAICGKERLSLENAEDSLYSDAPFVLTALDRTSAGARKVALQVIGVLGANPVWVDAEQHDRMLAMTSHLPYLLASALVLTTSKDAAELVGPGFRSTSRLADTPSSMMLGVLRSNRDNILADLKNLQGQLAQMENALIDDDPVQLQSMLDSAQAQYQTLLQ